MAKSTMTMKTPRRPLFALYRISRMTSLSERLEQCKPK